MRITVHDGKIVKAELSSSRSQEMSDEMQREDAPLVGNFKPGDKVTVLPSWKKHWSFKNQPAPTKGLWSKLIRPAAGVVTGVDERGTIWIADSYDQMHGGQGFPVLARFVKQMHSQSSSSGSDIHIQKDSFVSFCGRKIGTPGGKIYPGVRVELPSWFETHPYPHVVEGRVCKACLKAFGRNPLPSSSVSQQWTVYKDGRPYGQLPPFRTEIEAWNFIGREKRGGFGHDIWAVYPAKAESINECPLGHGEYEGTECPTCADGPTPDNA
jgi:hypothetical protein